MKTKDTMQDLLHSSLLGLLPGVRVYTDIAYATQNDAVYSIAVVTSCHYVNANDDHSITSIATYVGRFVKVEIKGCYIYAKVCFVLNRNWFVWKPSLF